jgi:hypothetical protein
MSWQLDFARQYCGWCAVDWEHVCWMEESTFEIGKNSRQVHVWRTAYERYSSSGFVGEHKSELVFMPRNQHKVTDFVELVYDSQLLQFMGKVSCSILMEDGALVHRSKAPEEWKKLHLI